MNRKDKKYDKKNEGKRNNTFFLVKEASGLMEFLQKQFQGKSRSSIKSLLTKKQVVVDGKVISKYNHPLVPGQKIEISKERIQAEQKFREYAIVYEDDDLIVIDKMAGLLSIATKSEKRATAFSLLSNHVKREDLEAKIYIVHRLDRETSGLMLFAKNADVKQKLQDLWIDTILERTYVAVVEGSVEKSEGKITSYLVEDKIFKVHSSNNALKGKQAITNYSVLKKNKSYSLLKVNLETGRKNQIRVHMFDLGHSIIGDKKYGATVSPIRRLGLHAQQLSFIHPTTGEKMNFDSKIPRVFMQLFK